MSHRSDILYKQLFSHPEMIRDLLVGCLPADWTRDLQAAAFERVNASYASDRGKARQDDMVWRVRMGGDWVYVYILLEFQARADHWMALRMQVYVGLLYQDLVAQRRLTRHGRLPPVLPIVLYHGRKPWRASTDLSELMLPAPEGLRHFQPQQQYLLIDQHRNHSVDGPSNVLALLFRLMRAQTDEEMRHALQAFAQRMKAPDMVRLRDSLARWIQSTLQDEFDETTISFEEEPAMLFDRKFKKYEDLLEYEAVNRGRARGLVEGREEGREKGREEGRIEGTRQVLNEVLQSALAGSGEELPAAATEKIAAADIDQLKRWLQLLAGGARPRQIFAEH